MCYKNDLEKYQFFMCTQKSTSSKPLIIAIIVRVIKEQPSMKVYTIGELFIIVKFHSF